MLSLFPLLLSSLMSPRSALRGTSHRSSDLNPNKISFCCSAWYDVKALGGMRWIKIAPLPVPYSSGLPQQKNRILFPSTLLKTSCSINFSVRISQSYLHPLYFKFFLFLRILFPFKKKTNSPPVTERVNSIGRSNNAFLPNIIMVTKSRSSLWDNWYM